MKTKQGKKEDSLKEYQVDLGERGIYDKRNPLNDLTGKEWTFSTKTVIPKAYPPSFSHKLRNVHGGQKPPEICQELIITFSKAGELVLDPFAGVGGTLLGASLAERKALGIEINPEFVKIYRRVCKENLLEEQPILVGDSRILLPSALDNEMADFVLTDVPFWAMDKLEKTRGVFSRAGEESKGKLKSSLNPFDSNQPQSIEEWLNFLEKVFDIVFQKLRENRYLGVFIGNMYRNIPSKEKSKRKIGRYLMLSAILAEMLEGIGFVLKSERIWYDTAKKLGVYGYPYTYVPSMVDQRILILKKEIL